MSRAREQILSALQQYSENGGYRGIVKTPKEEGLSKEDRVARITQMMEAVHGEVHRLLDREWMKWINTELPKRGYKHILVGSGDIGKIVNVEAMDSLQIHSYTAEIEEWKDQLFNQVDVSVTSTRGGIASTGSLVIWPTSAEPRLMYFVPPVHVALLNAEDIFESFEQMVIEQKWSKEMPTNSLLVSGPSKTADIQQVLAYGVHGPKQLVVLILG